MSSLARTYTISRNIRLSARFPYTCSEEYPKPQLVSRLNSLCTCPHNTTTDFSLKSNCSNKSNIKYRREEIIEVLKHRYAEKLQDNLPIFGIDKSSLTDFTTTEKDMKRMVSRFPPPNLRIKTEDLINKAASQETSSHASSAS